MMELKGKTAAITGAGSGIGRALAQALARKGVTLALADRDEAGVRETAAAIGAPRTTVHVLDVADEAAVHAFAADVTSAHGAVHIVANNAGVGLFGTFTELATDEIAWLMNVNFWGVVYGCKAFLPMLTAQPQACIVNVSSLFGLYAPPGQSAYAASKFAVRGLSESLRAELAASSGVHVVTVHPGGIRTAVARNSRVARAVDAAKAEKMTRRFDERFLTTPPETLANAIVAAIEHRRDRVVFGKDASKVDLLVRLFPSAAPRWFNRTAVRMAKQRR
jgi:short-subunit dehydrogenase